MSSSFGKARRDTGRWWDTPEKDTEGSGSTAPYSPGPLLSPRRTKSQTTHHHHRPPSSSSSDRQGRSPHPPGISSSPSSRSTNNKSVTKKLSKPLDKADNPALTNNYFTSTETDLNRLEDFARSLVPSFSSSSTLPNTTTDEPVTVSSAGNNPSHNHNNNRNARANVSQNDYSHRNEEKKIDEPLFLPSLSSSSSSLSSSSSSSASVPPFVPYVSPINSTMQIPVDPIMAQDDKAIAKVLAGVENLWALAATTELSLSELALKDDMYTTNRGNPTTTTRTSPPLQPSYFLQNPSPSLTASASVVNSTVPSTNSTVPSNRNGNKGIDNVISQGIITDLPSGESTALTSNDDDSNTNDNSIPPPPRTPPLPSPVTSSDHASSYMTSPAVADYLGLLTTNTTNDDKDNYRIPSVISVTPPLPPVLVTTTITHKHGSLPPKDSFSPTKDDTTALSNNNSNLVSSIINSLMGSNVSVSSSLPTTEGSLPSSSTVPSSNDDAGLLVREPSTVGETGLSSNPAAELSAEPSEQPDKGIATAVSTTTTTSALSSNGDASSIHGSSKTPSAIPATAAVTISGSTTNATEDSSPSTASSDDILSPSKTIESLLQKYSGTIQKLSSSSAPPVPTSSSNLPSSSSSVSSPSTAPLSESVLYRADEMLTRITTYLKEINTLRTIANEAKAALATATIAVRTTAEEAGRLRTERDQLVSQLRTIENERTDLRSALTQLRQQISLHNSEMSRIQQELDSTKRMIRLNHRSSHEDTISRLQSHIEKLYKESNELRNKTSEYEKQLAIETEARAYADKELANVRNELNQTRNQCSIAKIEADSARSESTRLRAKMDGLMAQTEGFQKRIKDAETLLLEIEADNVKTKAEAANEITLLKQQMADISVSSAVTLQRNKEEWDATLQRTLKDVHTYQQESNQLRNKLFTTEQTVEDLTKQRDEKITEIVTLNEQMEHLRSELRAWGPGRPIAETSSGKANPSLAPTTNVSTSLLPLHHPSSSSSSLTAHNNSASSVLPSPSSVSTFSTPVLYELTANDIDNLPILEKELHALRSEVTVHRFTVASLFRIALEAAHIPPEYNISELWRNLPGDLGDLAYQAAVNYQAVAAYKLPTHATTTSAAEYSNVNACVLNAQASFAWCAETGFGRNRDLIVASQYYRYAAESGLVNAQFQLGLFNQYTNTVNIDKYQAALWYQKAAENGHAGAAKALGLCYQLGIGGVKQDTVQASEWLRKATELRIQKKPEYLKKSTEPMLHIPIDASDQHTAELTRIAKYYQSEIDKNNSNPTALTALGKCYETGEGVPLDTNMAVMYYRKAAEINHPQAQYELGVCFRDGIGVQSNTIIAADWFRRAAKEKHPGAAYALGQLYAVGDGVELDVSHAVTWYILASNGGDVRAMCTLASCYEKGEGVSSIDYDQALYWYRKAAEKNFPLAQFNIGVYYRDGKGVPKDTLEALSWFRRAADQGYPPAQWSVGMCFEWGVGLPSPDFVQAFRWFQRSAEAGCAIAQYSMAHCYRHGKGVEPNPALADMWYKRAAEGGGLVVL